MLVGVAYAVYSPAFIPLCSPVIITFVPVTPVWLCPLYVIGVPWALSIVSNVTSGFPSGSKLALVITILLLPGISFWV